MPERIDASTAGSFGRVVGRSQAMQRIYPLCRRLADSDLPLVIGGETGTGKELLAESIHEEGRRSKGPFVVLDCTSIPSSLAEATLFGHEKGSFTGATEARRGLFEDADGGTLLLDEIGDLDIELQAKLLRVLERSEVTRVGSTRRIKVNVRFMAATRRDLREMVRQGKFRDDLYYRLAVTRIELPPLRERHGDLEYLVRTFWERVAGDGSEPSERLLEAFTRHDWPGNIRELHNAVARCFALGEDAWFEDASRRDRVAPPAMSSVVTTQDGDGGMFEEILELDLPLPKARRRILAEFEQRYVQRALERTGGNLTQAAQSSGVGSRYFRLIRARGHKSQS
ncbi:sigma 54-interacting transcriptional regulator [Paraliomyxa miuraensis]|uniref:sigma 54-interacting transcriptional regulator n=1 Tax=Paraliomyxa miuraensis TaxID=376150 RepID=UPI00225BE29D|nr:sigma-54 dependent transcriptional regulator [Paraliomyxa miuraensis]MCX4244860.1 sigma-54 dependent transcriptional regulator [Paraliomyxa miuraensis]